MVHAGVQGTYSRLRKHDSACQRPKNITGCLLHFSYHALNRLDPKVGCVSGASFRTILENVAGQKVTKWASRNCYKYTGIPANG